MRDWAVILLWLGSLFVTLGFPNSSSAGTEASIQAAFQAANEQYRDGKFDEAARGYRSVLEQGIESGPLYYNLGNALLKSERKGEALWAYLKAKRFIPRDSDLESNLEQARSLLAAAQTISVKPPPAVRWMTFGGRLSTRELAGCLGGFLWLLLIGWAGATWIPPLKSILRPVVWVSGAAAAIFSAALLTQTLRIESIPMAVAVQDSVQAKFSPQETGTTHFTLPEGAVVRVLQNQLGWAQVRREDGRSGWVREEAVRKL